MKVFKKSQRNKKAEHAFTYTVLLLYLFIILFPIIWAFLTSMKVPRDIFTIPPKIFFDPTLNNYKFVIFETEFFLPLINSLTVGFASTIVSLIVGIPAAYSLARFKFRGSESLSIDILSIRMMPPIVPIISLFFIWNWLGLIDTVLSLIITYTIFNLPIVVWMMRGFFREIPTAVEEAAMLDGCSQIGAFLKIVLPLARSGIVATSIICFIFSWNEFLFALSFTRGFARTLPVAITGFIAAREVFWGPMCAEALMIVIPVLIFALLVQRHLITGLASGMVKG